MPDSSDPFDESPDRRIRHPWRWVTGAIVVAGAALALLFSGGPDRKIDPIRQAALDSQARRAGCTLAHPKEAGFSDHTDKPVRYPEDPPSSGRHHPEAAADGSYLTGRRPALEKLVHANEHGRIVFWGRPSDRGRLQRLFDDDKHHVLVVLNTAMDARVAATTWGERLTCPRFDQQTSEVLAGFRDLYRDKGPEFVR